jgi:hypothetical protein
LLQFFCSVPKIPPQQNRKKALHPLWNNLREKNGKNVMAAISSNTKNYTSNQALNLWHTLITAKRKDHNNRLMRFVGIRSLSRPFVPTLYQQIPSDIAGQQKTRFPHKEAGYMDFIGLC